jgi:hypothetical protein
MKVNRYELLARKLCFSRDGQENTPNPKTSYTCTPEQLKAFAESIILECCEVALDHLDSEYTSGDIADHFGYKLPDDFGQ